MLTLPIAAATPLPPATGDWIIDVNTSVSGTDLQVNGSMEVTNNSVLSLDNLTLTLSAPGGGVAWVNVGRGSTALFDNLSVDRGSLATTLGGRIEGALTLGSSTWRNISAVYPDGTGGLLVTGGTVVMASSLFSDCVTGFTLSSGSLRVTDSRIEGCSDSLSRGDPTLAGALNLTVARTRFSSSGGLLNVTCSPCAGTLALDVSDVDFAQGAWPRGSLLDITGTSDWSLFRTRFERVNVTSANFSLQSVFEPTGTKSHITILDTTIRNVTLTGALASLGVLYMGVSVDAVSVTIEDSVVPGFAGFYLLNSPGPSAGNGTFSISVRRSQLGQTAVTLYSGGSLSAEVSDSTIWVLGLAAPVVGKSRITVENCSFVSRPGFESAPGFAAVAPGVVPMDVEVRSSRFVSSGIHTAGPTNFLLENSSFTNAAMGLWVEGAARLWLNNNTFSNVTAVLTSANRLDLSGFETNTFSDVGVALNLSAEFHLTLRNFTFSNVQYLINLTAIIDLNTGLPVTSVAGSTLVLEDVHATKVTTLVKVSEYISFASSLPVNVTLSRISILGGARGGAVLNYSAPGMVARMSLTDIYSEGNGTAPGIWIRYGDTLNVTMSNISLHGHTTAIRVERKIASSYRDDWAFYNITIDGAINGIELLCAHVADATFTIADPYINASGFDTNVLGTVGNITGGVLLGNSNHIEVHDSQVVMRDTNHNFRRVLTDFRLGVGYLEAYGNWSAYNLTLRWAPTQWPVAGWHLVANAISGEPFLDTILDASGRSTQPLSYGLIYRFQQNLTNFDARALDGTLEVPGRKPSLVHVEFAGDLSALVDVPDDVLPDVALPAERFGGIYSNRSTFPLAFQFWDPESRLTNVSIEVSGVSVVDILAAGAPQWWNLTVNVSLPFPATYLLEIYARDAAGNQLHAQRYVLFDNAAPTVAILDPVPPGPLNYADFVLSVAIDPDVVFLVLDGDGGHTVNGTALPTWTVALNLTEGVHNFTIDVLDRADNWGRVSFVFVIDLTPPSPLVAGISSGLEVNATPLQVTVTTGADDTVFFDGLERAGTLGNVRFPVDLLLRWTTHTLVVTDPAGNSVAYTYSVNLDVWPPTIELQAPFLAGGVYFVNRSSIDVSALVSPDTDHVEVEGLSAFPDGGSLISAHLQFAEGEHPVTFVAIDRTGDRTAVSFTLVVDFQPPSLLDSDPPDGAAISTHTATLHLRLDEGAEVRWSSFTAPGPTGTANLSVPVVPGANTFTLLLVDPAGNSRSVTLTFTGDFVRPSILLSSPTNGSVTEASSIRISGQTEAGASVFLGSLRLDVANDGTFSVDVPLQAGENTIILTARDPAGNEATAVLVVTRGSGANTALLIIGLAGAVGAAVLAVLFKRFRSKPLPPPRPPIVEPPPSLPRGPPRPPH